MKRAILALTCFVGILLYAGAAVAQTAVPAGGTGVPVFRAGDLVRVTVWGSPELSGEFEIGDEGVVIHPLYRAVRIVGMSVPQAETAIRRVLQRFETEPEFVVEPRFRVAVTGEVRSPNIYTVNAYTTIPQAVAQAGGVTPLAVVQRVRLLREGREYEVDLTRPVSETADLRLRSGDQVVVDRRANFWRDRIQPVLTSAGAIASLSYAVLRITRVL